MTDISNSQEVKELLEDGRLTIKQKTNIILDQANYLLDEITELEEDRDDGHWECDNCQDLEFEIQKMNNNMLDPSDAITFRVISVTDKELILENHLSPGQTYTWVPDKELGLVQDV